MSDDVPLVSFLCIHLIRTPEIPCVLIVQDEPWSEFDTGKAYFCVSCYNAMRAAHDAKKDFPFTTDNFRVLLDKDCFAMTIVKTI